MSLSEASEFEHGFLFGLLVGEGHFGGDGRQPQVTLRMHIRHEGLFRWLEATFPGGRLYGPYNPRWPRILSMDGPGGISA